MEMRTVYKELYAELHAATTAELVIHMCCCCGLLNESTLHSVMLTLDLKGKFLNNSQAIRQTAALQLAAHTCHIQLN
jgi:hypothetical protein